jgi:hypothetical protein
VGEEGAHPALDAQMVGVRMIAGGSSTDSEQGAAEGYDEAHRGGTLAALNDWRPCTGPLHARPPASWFEVGDHAKRDYSLQFLFRQMSEPT